MKKQIKRSLAIVIVLLIVGTLVWRLWPRSISHILSTDLAAVTHFSAVASVTVFRDGESVTHTYSLNDPRQLQALLDILSTSGYRPDMRNLMPKRANVASGGKYYDGRQVMLDFITGNAPGTYSGIFFLSSDVLAVTSPKGSGLLIYHPTNPETLDALMEYLQTHGEKKLVSKVDSPS